MKIKALLFDLGNVLIDCKPEIFITSLEERTRIPKEQLARYFLTSYVDSAYTEGKISSDKFFDVVRRDLNLAFHPSEFREIWCSIFEAKDEMERLVSRLKESYPVWILSNTNEWHFDFLKARYPVLNLVDRFFLSYKIRCQKPDPKIYEHVVREVGLKPEEIFFTDDIEVNVSSAKQAGLNAVLFQSAQTLTEELRALGVLNHEK